MCCRNSVELNSEHSPLSALADGAKWWPGVCNNNCLVITPHSRLNDLNTEVTQIADIDPVEAAYAARRLIDNRLESCPRYDVSVIDSSVLKSPARITGAVEISVFNAFAYIFLNSPVSWTAGSLGWPGRVIQCAKQDVTIIHTCIHNSSNFGNAIW